MQDHLRIQGLEVFAHVGVFDFEREDGQIFRFDLDLFLGHTEASQSDDLAASIHYGEVVEALVPVIQASKRQLIEALAGDIARFLLERYPLLAACTVTVHKPFAPVEATFQDIAISIHRKRSEGFYLGLGSNLGDKKAQIDFAIRRLEAEPKVSMLRVAPYVLSKAWGFEEQPDFLNTVVEGQFEGSPYELLERCQAIEKAAGRERSQHWGPRTLDIDLLEFGSVVNADPKLRLPHPFIHVRDFVRIPLQYLKTGMMEASPSLRMGKESQVSEHPEYILLVDCQYDFIDGSLACQRAEEAVAYLTAYIKERPEARVLYSLDWHRPSNHSFKKHGGIWPVHCVQGSRGAMVHQAFEALPEAQRPHPGNAYLKGQDDLVEEYSAFLAKTEEGEALQAVLPKAITVAGIATEYCVKETVLAFHKAGHEITVLEAGLAYVDPKDHAASLAIFQEMGVHVKGMEE